MNQIDTDIYLDRVYIEYPDGTFKLAKISTFLPWDMTYSSSSNVDEKEKDK